MPFSVVGSSQKNLTWLYDDLGINYPVLTPRSDVLVTWSQDFDQLFVSLLWDGLCANEEMEINCNATKSC